MQLGILKSKLFLAVPLVLMIRSNGDGISDFAGMGRAPCNLDGSAFGGDRNHRARLKGSLRLNDSLNAL